MIGLLLTFGFFIIAYKFFKHAQKGSTSKQNTNKHVITITMSVIEPSAEDWAREKELRAKEKQDSISSIKASYIAPKSPHEAFEAVREAIATMVNDFGLSISTTDIEATLRDFPDQKKKEQKLRKSINDTYKLRDENKSMLFESLYYAYLHAKLIHDSPSSEWKSFTGLKRLITNLNNDLYRKACLGLLHFTKEASKETNPALYALCEEEMERSFAGWHTDLQREQTFKGNVTALANEPKASDKHFILNAIVEHLERKVWYNPKIKSSLIEYCEQDIALYKTFLAEFTSFSGRKISFKTALKSEYYHCPRLPSFDALWNIYETEGNKTQLQRLQKVANEIRYNTDTTIESIVNEKAERQEEDHVVDTTFSDWSPQTEIIEATKSDKTGKKSFLDANGNHCSIEDVAKEHFEKSGYKVLRGEVQFWQAMFGIFFWEEIFAGSDAPEGINDIPTDLFSGESFYTIRKDAIDKKALLIKSGNLKELYRDQLKKHASKWTRIIYSGGRGDFSYKKTLESMDVMELLSIIDPTMFSRMLHRIAMNPTEHRSGLPDFTIWKNSEVSFIEIKGMKESIRDGQLKWLKWMENEAIKAKIIRVKPLKFTNVA